MKIVRFVLGMVVVLSLAACEHGVPTGTTTPGDPTADDTGHPFGSGTQVAPRARPDHDGGVVISATTADSTLVDGGHPFGSGT